MIQSLYNLYYMSRMLKDKSISSIIDYYYNDYQKVERVYPHNGGLIVNMYNLTYEPTHIIDTIYLGNAYNASNYSNIINNNIKLIINITEEIPNYYNDVSDIEYYNITVKDLNNNHLTDFLSITIKKIRNYILENNNDVDNDVIDNNKKNGDSNKKKNILVHCFMGSSRSATIVIAYLSKYHNMTIDEALKYCKEKRDLVNINTTFYDDLQKWYKLECINTN